MQPRLNKITEYADPIRLFRSFLDVHICVLLLLLLFYLFVLVMRLVVLFLSSLLISFHWVTVTFRRAQRTGCLPQEAVGKETISANLCSHSMVLPKSQRQCDGLGTPRLPEWPST